MVDPISRPERDQLSVDHRMSDTDTYDDHHHHDHMWATTYIIKLQPSEMPKDAVLTHFSGAPNSPLGNDHQYTDKGRLYTKNRAWVATASLVGVGKRTQP